MSKRFIASVTLFSFLSLGAPVVAAPAVGSVAAQGATIESCQGDVTLRSTEAVLKSGQSLAMGEAVKVGADSKLTLSFPNGNRVRMAPGSEFRLVPGKDGQPSVYLLSGKALTAATSPVMVQTYRSNVVASSGEFVVETEPTNTSLRVLSGNASMKSLDGASTAYDLLQGLPSKITNGSSLAFANLSSQQSLSEVEFGAQGKGKKGTGIRDATKEVPAAGLSEAFPDQDMINPGEEPAVVVETPPEPPVKVVETPVTPTTPAEPVASGGGGLSGGAIAGIIGGAALIAGLIILANDSDDDEPIIVPSPSFP